MTPRAARRPKARPAAAGSFLHPLDTLYAAQGLPLPEFKLVEGDAVPAPYRKLLVHEKDMTPTLERFHASRIYIQVLRRERREDFYLREVVLRLEEDETPVEFGANRVRLENFTPEARWLILQERLPLGRILKDHHVNHVTRPLGFFQLKSDALVSRALGVAAGTVLYGRKALIADASGRPLSEVIEILPPAV